MSLDELYTSPQIAKRLGVSRQRVDQLVESGQLPNPVGRSGRNRLWRASDIELALAGSDPATGRPPTPAWGTIPAPEGPLRLDVDEVLDVPGIWSIDETPRVHVRIWRGPAGGTQRTVVLYGALAESHGIIINFAESIVRAIAARHLSVGEARGAWYFGFLPRGFPRPELGLHYVSFAFPRVSGTGGLLDSLLRRGSRDAWNGEFEEPVWQNITPEQLTRVLGAAPDLDFPPGTYTASVVTALAAGRRPAVVDFDPKGLASQLRQVMRLHTYRSALQAGDYTRDGLPALGLLTGSGHDEAARTAEALGIAVRVLVPSALVAVEDYRAQSAADDPGAALVERRFHQPGQAETDLLLRYANMSDRDLTTGAVHRALTTVRSLTAALADQAETAGPQADTELSEALAAAEPELVSTRHLLDPSLIDDPGPSLKAITEPGDAEHAYLATVSWWGPAAGDAHRAAALRGHLWEKDLDGLRTGYDPFGRLVLHNPTTGSLAVERPRALPPTPYPDGAEVVATYGSLTAFVRLPDGRCDILPTDPRDIYDDITWGYEGSGPETLARALSFAALSHPDPEHPLRLEDRTASLASYLLELTASLPQYEPLTISLQALRRRQ
ncbi:helix-turn-helix domain-containing protein [Streptomyces sp. NPDC048212]|uniref:helix-turn-helix transcriptional regulator n=1 Tax=unclassified Streptomyces TaxID=2593676 RepID=UPI002275EA59|nr:MULTISPECIES: helix-turn-helix domain-containing protein [unclassified Streptomyces]MCY1649283.1 helix-turn-helix domain-containing protein [Streptomyces sp. SL203]MCY1676996.1 helix-turn-helix domain-containing protein [Streptomyces sp. SL294]